MTPSDAQRLALRQQLIELLDEEPAMTLMESLPPMDWNELATKADIEAIDARFDVIDSRFDVIDSRFDVIDARFEAIDSRFEAIDLRFEAMGDRIDKGFADVGGESKRDIGRVHHDIGRVHRDIARLTYVILAGVAAAVTPIYIFLLTGAGT